ncbi:unnamed protein product [Prorocentrum cordatum]|uniref:Uncharacterized protein n=1 Tax=Prorocentrum cordatum TaxID=2364126 RepID=A0ABN9T1I3_9DINO|nr:unnamed protein product [Polarella glacialis]
MCGARRNGCGGETDVVCGRAPAKAASGRDDPACRPPAAQEQKEAGAAEEDEEGGQRQGGGGGRGKSELDLRWCTPGGGPVGPAETPGGSGKEARGCPQDVCQRQQVPGATEALPGAACVCGVGAAPDEGLARAARHTVELSGVGTHWTSPRPEGNREDGCNLWARSR